MPQVIIKLAGTTAPEKKAELIHRTTFLIEEVLGKRASATHVVIEEINPDNWGVGGETITAIRKKAVV